MKKKWNDKITTLPGLYFATTTPLRAIAKLMSLDADEMLARVCNLAYLRLSNLVINIVNFVMLFLILDHLNAKKLENSKVKHNLSNQIRFYLLKFFFYKKRLAHSSICSALSRSACFLSTTSFSSSTTRTRPPPPSSCSPTTSICATASACPLSWASFQSFAVKPMSSGLPSFLVSQF